MFYGIGLTAETITDLADLETPIPYPKSEPPHYETVECGDGSLFEVGSEKFSWELPYMEPAWVSMMRTFCPGSSATVFVSTKLEDDTFGVRQVKLLFPKLPPREGGNYPNVRFEFTRSVEVAGS